MSGPEGHLNDLRIVVSLSVFELSFSIICIIGIERVFELTNNTADR